MQLLFVTSNDHKVLTANHVCQQFGVTIARQTMELEEIQTVMGEDIARHKASQAFSKLKQPVVVSDDTWLIPGLNGFPGPYMKYINQWFTPDDFLHLTLPLKDRRIIIQQIICYQDSSSQKVFSVEVEGLLLTTARGTSPYPHFTVTSFDGGQHSAAEINAAGYPALNNSHTAWHELCRWITARHN